VNYSFFHNGPTMNLLKFSIVYLCLGSHSHLQEMRVIFFSLKDNKLLTIFIYSIIGFSIS